MSVNFFNNHDSREPLVSIVLGSFNGETHIHEQIESILSQTYTNLELIIVDDFSQDKTLQILKSFAEVDNRIRIYPAPKNLGLVANFERGLTMAKGDFVALSDQDDVFDPKKIEILLDALENDSGSDMVVSDVALINEQGALIADSLWQYHNSKPMPGKPFKRLVLGNFATGCAMMFRKTLLDRALPFPPDIEVHDWWLALVASTDSSGGITIVKQPLVKYRQHDTNVIGARPITKISRTIKTFFLDFEVLKAKSEYMHHECLSGLKRIEGYLTRRELWSASEYEYLQKAKGIYLDMTGHENQSIYARVLSIPSRVRLFCHIKKIRKCLQVIFVTLFGATISSKK